MKKTTWDNPNKMHFESGHKSFDRQTNIIGTGNMLANTQTSLYVRPYTEAKNPVGEARPKGAMQKWDLDNFYRLDPDVRHDVEGFTRSKSGILYQFHHKAGGKSVIDGYILTDSNHVLLGKWVTNKNSEKIIAEAEKYVVVSKGKKKESYHSSNKRKKLRSIA